MKVQTELYTNSNFRSPMSSAPSRQAAAAVSILSGLGATEAQIMGRAPVPETDVMVSGWTFRPWEQDTCDLPPIAWQRMVVLQQAGIVPVSYVIAHEPEQNRKDVMLLPVKHELEGRWARAGQQVRDFGMAAAPVALSVAKTAVKLAAVSAVAAGVVTLGVLGVMAAALASDPILFALMPAEDGGLPVWVCIARWYPKE